MRPGICALFVVNWLSLKPIAVGKLGNIFSSRGGQSLEPAVGQDGRVTRHFDEDVGKTKLETEGAVSFILAGDNRTRRVEVVNAARLADRLMRPQINENTQGDRQPGRILRNAGSADQAGVPSKQRHCYRSTRAHKIRSVQA